MRDVLVVVLVVVLIVVVGRLSTLHLIARTLQSSDLAALVVQSWLLTDFASELYISGRGTRVSISSSWLVDEAI